MANLSPTTIKNGRSFFSTRLPKIELPNLIEIQKNSFQNFIDQEIAKIFKDFSPINDLTSSRFSIRFLDYKFAQPKLTPKQAIDSKQSYEATMTAKVELTIKALDKKVVSDIYFGDYPIMTDRGTFVINGVERIIVSQLVRSSGIFFNKDQHTGYFSLKITPARGAWIEIEIAPSGLIWVKIDKKRKFHLTTLLRALGMNSEAEIKKAFAEVDDGSGPMQHYFITNTLAKEPTKDSGEAALEVYRKLRPGDPATIESASKFIHSLFFEPERYDLSEVGRYKFNKRLKANYEKVLTENTYLSLPELVAVAKEAIRLSNVGGNEMDQDHLSNRRLRMVGEQVARSFRIGMSKMRRVAIDRMSLIGEDDILPAQLINVNPVVTAVRQFYAQSQLSKLLDQVNPLSEISDRRRLSAMGPGGLTKERAGFEVRDVHKTQYGRICPVETPEGPNVGLVLNLASYARVNKFGFIETPYIKVKNRQITDEIVWLDAADEEQYIIAPFTVQVDKNNKILDDRVVARSFESEAITIDAEQIDLIDVSSSQITGAAAMLIPFIENNYSWRSLYAAAMQKQSVPTIKGTPPLIGTGFESEVARDSGRSIVADQEGEVTKLDSNEVVIKTGSKAISYQLDHYRRGNQDVAIHQLPIVQIGDKVKKGQTLAEGSGIKDGELAIGQNLLVAYISYHGFGFEDSVLISERLVKEDVLSSVHISTHEIEVRETKLGPEETTADIPNVGLEAIRNLDEQGIVRIGAQVGPGDILVGKITPKGEAELSSEERLLRAIFGEKARDVRDTSLRLPNGESGKVIDIKVYQGKEVTREKNGVIKKIEVSIAQMRKIQVGDKLAGRHGNKGVICKILPEADMPYLADGRPIDIVLNPLGIVSRMNVGQILETMLGMACNKLNIKIACPPFDGLKLDQISDFLKQAELPEDGKFDLYDGLTGEKLDKKAIVGYQYILKLNHMVDDKIHARSTGPYAMITQQPLGGKAMRGGQRFGEMEVWALQAYGAAHILQELLTVKSDDVLGRSKIYENLVKGDPMHPARTPESFKVLVRELQSLGLDLQTIDSKAHIQEDANSVIESDLSVEELSSTTEADDMLLAMGESPDTTAVENISDDFEVLENLDQDNNKEIASE